MNSELDKIDVAGISVNLFSVSTLNETIRKVIIHQEKRLFLHANARLIRLAHRGDEWLLPFFKGEVDYVMCDGVGIQWAAFLSNQRIPEKIPYNIWIWDFIKFLVQNDFSIYLLGADEKTIIKAKEKLLLKEPKLRILGYRNGFFNKERAQSENTSVIEQINKVNPNILLVGFGMPLQEKWIQENYKDLKVNCILSCGGAFDFVSGNKAVAPYLIRKLSLEWLFRWILEPRRLLKRNTVAS